MYKHIYLLFFVFKQKRRETKDSFDMISSIYKYCAKHTNANHYDQLVDWTVNLLVHLLLDTTHFVGTLKYHPNFKHSNSSHLLQCCVSQCVVQGNIHIP